MEFSFENNPSWKRRPLIVREHSWYRVQAPRLTVFEMLFPCFYPHEYSCPSMKSEEIFARIDQAERSNKICPITKKPIIANQSRITECGHVCHALALEKWIQLKTNCPLCKRRLIFIA